MRPQIDFQTPCAAFLLDKIPVRICDLFRIEQRLLTRRFISLAHLWRIDHAIDDDVRHVNTLRPQLDCERLRQATHSKFCAAECKSTTAATH